MAVVFRLPALDLDRRVQAYRVRRQSVFERGQIDERLEGGAGLALGGDRAIELAFAIASSADQGAHRAVRRHRHQRALADAALAALLRQFFGERLLRARLQAGVDRGAHHDVLVDVAEHVVDRVHNPIGDIIDRAVAGLRGNAGRMRERGFFAGGRDETDAGHGGEHGLSAALGAVEIARRRQPRRRFHQAGEQRRLRQAYLPGGLAEIALRRLFDAVGAGAEIDAVQIQLEDLRLGEFALQPQRQQHLLQLAMDGTLLSEKEIFRQLLRDGGGALRHAAMQNVGDGRARDAPRIDAVMLVEAPILDGDEGLRHVARHFLQRQDGAAAVAAGGERAAVDVDDLDRGRPLGDLQRLQRRHMRAGPGNGAGGADDEPQPQHQAPIDRAADQRAARRTFAALLGAFAFGWRLAAAACRTVASADAQLGGAVEHRLPARARMSLALRHRPTRLAMPAATRRPPKGTLNGAV